jgi:hypothetical protein
MARLYSKDPGEKLKYTFDWVDWLSSGETISTSSWTVPSGLTKVAEVNTTTTSTVTLDGGTLGTTYRCKLTITTNQGQIAVRSVDIRVEER